MPHDRKTEARRRVLERGLIACYEIIDRIRKELAELDARGKLSANKEIAP